MIKVPKSGGIKINVLSSDATEQEIFNQYIDYFRGRHYQVFARNAHKRPDLGLEELKELDPQPINLPID